MIHRFTISRSARKYFWGNIVVWLSMFHYFTLFSGFLAYVIIAKRKIKLTNVDLFFISGLTLITVYHLAMKPPSEVLLDFRFYWGWTIFYFIFKANTVSYQTIRTVLVVFSILTLVEVALINTVITPEMLPNFPKGDQNPDKYNYAIQGYYQRPNSYSGIPTAGSTLLAVMMAICNVQGWRFWLPIGAVLSIVSGTGTFALLLVLWVRYRQLLIKAAPLLAVILLLFGVVYYSQIMSIIDMFSYKVGPNYLMYLLDFKWKQIMYVYNKTALYETFIGLADVGDWIGRGADFGFLSFVATYGIFGILLFLLMVLSRANKSNRFPLFIILAASMHYGVINTFPGQMILGLLMAMNNNGLPDQTESVPIHSVTHESVA